MIVFLTLCYCGALALLVKFGLVKLTLWWKLSPLAWMSLLLVVLFIPMQWGAPAGPVNVYQGVVEIVPNVAGEVIDVPAQGLKPVRKGDILFRIDPVPYAATVDQLKAQLADTKQNVERLKASAEAANATVEKTIADIELAKADQVTATASVTAAMAALQEAKGKKDKAVVVAADLQVQITAARREYDRKKTLVAENAVSQSDVDIAEIKITGLKSQLNTTEIDIRVADDTIARSQADVTAAESGLVAADLRVKQLVETELPRVRANAREAELAANSMIGDEHTSVAAVRAQLENAEYDLGQTVVRAPSDGFIIGMSLRPGQRVAAVPVRSWMSFVPSESTTLIAGIPQYALRHVRPGQKTEVTLKLYPGRVFSATVDDVACINTQGQLQPSGTVAAAPGVDQTAAPFVVRLRLDDDADIDVASLRGGAVGTAAVYTNISRASHLIRRVMIRMEAWMNFVIPW